MQLNKVFHYCELSDTRRKIEKIKRIQTKRNKGGSISGLVQNDHLRLESCL